METVPVNANIEIQDYVPPKEKVTTYDFILVGNRAALISVWLHVGDTVHVGRAGWEFTFPRLKTTISINRAHYVLLTTQESERIYVDAMELQKAIVKEAVERKEKKNGKEAKA